MTHPPRIHITPEHVDGTDYWDSGCWTTTEGAGVAYVPESQWQPIETAPSEERSEFLVYDSVGIWKAWSLNGLIV